MESELDNLEMFTSSKLSLPNEHNLKLFENKLLVSLTREFFKNTDAILWVLGTAVMQKSYGYFKVLENAEGHSFTR